MNILCVGNSFAVDAATYVHQIAKALGQEINIAVLYIPGCPIEKHWRNYCDNIEPYEFYVNGESKPTMICNIFKGLSYKKWDYVTFQQRSGDSVDASTFFPELPLLIEGVRKFTDATFVLHRTWSYARAFSHERYGSNPMDQDAMDRDIVSAYEEVSDKVGIPYIIPSGSAIRLAREVFGDDLNRDGYHLNERGRALVGILWVYYLLGIHQKDAEMYRLSGFSYEPGAPMVSDEEIEKLKEIALRALAENGGHNLGGNQQ